MKIYTLRHIETKKYMNIYAQSNEYDDTVAAELVDFGNTVIWSTTDKNHAEKISNESIDWHDSDVESPKHDYVGKLEVVEFSMT